MAEVRLEALEVFGRTKQYLQHLLRCRDLLAEMMDQNLIEAVFLSADKKRDNWRVSRLQAALDRLSRLHSNRSEATASGLRMRPVELWLDDVEELKAAEDVLDVVYAHVAPYDPDKVLPPELMRKLRSLNGLDDSY